MDPTSKYVGIGVAYEDGNCYIAEDFIGNDITSSNINDDQQAIQNDEEALNDDKQYHDASNSEAFSRIISNYKMIKERCKEMKNI